MVTKKKTVKTKPLANVNCNCYEWHGYFPFGAFLFLLVGVLWFAKNHQWFTGDFWPMLFIVMGLLLLVKAIYYRFR